MMMIKIFTLALLACALASASDVVDVTPETIDGILGKDTHVFLEVYAPWCGHCKVRGAVFFFPAILTFCLLRTSPRNTSWWARLSPRSTAWWWPR